jgi:hypothetical protein
MKQVGVEPLDQHLIRPAARCPVLQLIRPRHGDWPRGLSVVEVSARAVIGGVTYEADSVSIDREIPSTMPAQTMTTGGYSPARAKLTIEANHHHASELSSFTVNEMSSCSPWLGSR